MAKHNINITLTDEEELFIRRLVKYDRETKRLNGNDEKVTFGSELKSMFYTELAQMMNLYKDEFEMND